MDIEFGGGEDGVGQSKRRACCVVVLVLAAASAGQSSNSSESKEVGPAISATDATQVVADIQRNMVAIPTGHFIMGNAKRRSPSSEQPAHRVEIRAFLMSKYEVTFRQYDAYAAATRAGLPNDEGWGRGNRPVINVSWRDAKEFIDWLNRQSGQHYRLPSEAEWEYVARSATATEYPWGDTFDSGRANGKGVSGADLWPQTAPVGSFPPNNWKLYDMIGNVMEWTADCWNANYSGAPTNGSAWQQGDCGKRVFRGGAWTSTPSYLTVSFRMFVDDSFRNHALGFRLAADP
jgi:formylglycine-generating enzyme required for sulfatase activity